MPTLSAFAAMAAKAGVVPHVPQQGNGLGNIVDTRKHQQEHRVGGPVPHVPLVPLGNDVSPAQFDLQVAFEERAAILEYDEELPRHEAERLAKQQVYGVAQSDP